MLSCGWSHSVMHCSVDFEDLAFHQGGVAITCAVLTMARSQSRLYQDT